MNNKTSIEVSNAKLNSKKYHAKKNKELYKEYIDSGKQFSQSFADWKKSLRFKNEKTESMQSPLSPNELKQKGYSTKSLNQLVRWK